MSVYVSVCLYKNKYAHEQMITFSNTCTYMHTNTAVQTVALDFTCSKKSCVVWKSQVVCVS